MLGSRINNYQWENADFRIIYTKNQDGNFNDYNANASGVGNFPYTKRLVIHIPSALGGDAKPMIMTLAFLGDKNAIMHHRTKDYEVESIDTEMQKRLEKGEKYVELMVPYSAIGKKGVNIFINTGKPLDNGKNSVNTTYTIE
jgi:hypothetical protein